MCQVILSSNTHCQFEISMTTLCCFFLLQMPATEPAKQDKWTAYFLKLYKNYYPKSTKFAL